MSLIVDMQVIKRNGQREDVSFDKVLNRIRKAAGGLSVNGTMIAQKVLASIIDGIHTSELDDLTCITAIGYITEHPDYETLASRIAISNHHKSTPATMTEAVHILASVRNAKGVPAPAVSKKLTTLFEKHADHVESHIQYERDYLFDYFGFKTLEKSYLLRDTTRRVIERPQHMWMRTALELWAAEDGSDADWDKVWETYDAMSQKFYTHATPTLFNSCTPTPQLSSCFLLAMKEDSINGIYDTLKDCAIISKYSGGIGLHVHNVRAKGSLIHGTNGVSNGLVPMLRVFNNTALYVDQCFTPDTLVFTEGGAKRIEDIGVGDKVLTASGSYEPVDKPVRHEYSGTMLEVSVKNAISPIRLTPEHQVLVLNGQDKMMNFNTIKNRLEKNLATPMWMDARDLRVGDFVVYPIPKHVHDIESLSVDDCRFYGILVGDGHVDQNSAYVSLGLDSKKEVAEFVVRYLEYRGVQVHERVENNTRRIRWSPNNPGFKFTRAQLYDENKEKRIATEFLHLPRAKILQVVRGLLETDGCIGSKEVTLEMSSASVIESVRYLLLRIGTLASGYDRDRIGNVSSYKNIATRKATKVLLIPRTKEICEMFPEAPRGEYFTYFEHDGRLFSRVEAIGEGTYNGIVHDFEIKPSHNYTIAHMGIVHNGGGKRNGSFAIYLEPWHADVEDFIRLKMNTGVEDEKARDLFYAMWISDLFMERVIKNEDWTLFCPAEAPGLADVWGDDFKSLYERYEAEGRGRKTMKAQKLWFEILDAQIETGTPYLVYKDAANRKSNQQNLGTIKSSNLCVAPETPLLTDAGYYPISELKDKKVRVWNGDNWSDVEVKQTGVDQEIVNVNLSDGSTIACTPYHKFLVSESYGDKPSFKDAKRVDAGALEPNTKLLKYTLPVIEGNPDNDFKYAYTHGFFCGDGTYNSNGTPRLSLYGDKKAILPLLDIRSTSGQEDAAGRINVQLPLDIAQKFKVPINASLKNRLDWLAGYLDADGCVTRNGDNESLQASSIHFHFLDDIRLMLHTLGLQAKISFMHDTQTRMMPDGHGGSAHYECKPVWRLLISSSGLYRLANLGFITHRLKFISRKPQRNAEQFVQVLSVVKTGRTDNTFCFTEAQNHTGVFNGILTGNCSEIIEYSSADETAVCNLASMALPAYVTNGHFNFSAFRDKVRLAVRNLDRVIDVNFYPTPETLRSNMRHRPIGLGVQGLADVFALLGLAWEDQAAVDLNRRIFAHMYYAAVEASVERARESGPYETFAGSPASRGDLQFDLWNVEPVSDTELDWSTLKQDVVKHGLRNSLLVAPMPTASTSQILGYNECIEPFTSNIYTRRTLAGEFILVNKHLLRELIKRGIWNAEVKNKIIANGGSVQGVREIPTEIQRLYKTVWEMKQRTLIDLAADRGAYVCQSQSLNLYVADPDYKKLTSMHVYAWQKGLKTGIYYLRTKSSVTAQQFTVEPVKAVSSSNQEDKECLMCSS